MKIPPVRPTTGGEPGSYPTRSAGFSVPEMLAVVAIIVIILSLLLPNLNQSREIVRRTMCLNRLHQQSMAARNYGVDNTQHLPPMKYRETGDPWSYFRDFLMPYMANEDEMMIDPSHLPIGTTYYDPYKGRDETVRITGTGRMDYGVNHYGRGNGQTSIYLNSLGPIYDRGVWKGGSGTAMRGTDVANQDVVYYACAEMEDSPWDIGGVSRGKMEWPIGWSFDNHAFNRHLNGYNSVGLDGHAVWHPADPPSNEAWFARKR